MSMVVARSAKDWIAQLGGPAAPPSFVTVGNFDGVHRGHQLILENLILRAGKSGSRAAVLTFDPHPARILRPDLAPTLLMTLDQRLRAFDAAGIDATLVLTFDEILAKVSAEDFVSTLLVEQMHARLILVGENFRFGHKGAGDVALLRTFGARWGFEVEIVPPVEVGGIIVSSTAVRSAVREGRMEDAAKFLGHPFTLAGEIRTGSGLGRKFVVPTLNLASEQETLPKNGVYATLAFVNGKMYRAATNVGIRPTFDAGKVSIESHLLEFSENLTSGPLEVRFITRLRDEQKFTGPEALREQILRDIARANELLAAKPSGSLRDLGLGHAEPIP
jgi:riboflavin kinase / FMN adenylyltransferase